MKPLSFLSSVCILFFVIVVIFFSCEAASGKSNEPATQQAMVEKGAYLITIGGCNDCHTPKIMTPTGMSFDSSKLLAGHIADEKIPPPDKSFFIPGNWTGSSPDVTAFAGPWGISYGANLTPDTATGIGSWREEDFIKTLRTGKHMGIENGKPILPPMPWYGLAQLKNEDLKAMFAYLKSLKPIRNKVPDAVAPNVIPAHK